MTKTRRRMTILDLMLLIAGLAVGLWLVFPGGRSGPDDEGSWLFCFVFALGGLSAVGPPLLLWERYRRRSRFRLGELLWFIQGTASWLLWPPIIYHRVRLGTETRTMAPICYFYGTPRMALYVGISLLAGGWLRRAGPGRRASRSWTETFGLLLALIWACTGLYLLVLIYRRDLLQ
jgi:hypothetical protein